MGINFQQAEKIHYKHFDPYDYDESPETDKCECCKEEFETDADVWAYIDEVAICKECQEDMKLACENGEYDEM